MKFHWFAALAILILLVVPFSPVWAQDCTDVTLDTEYVRTEESPKRSVVQNYDNQKIEITDSGTTWVLDIWGEYPALSPDGSKLVLIQGGEGEKFLSIVTQLDGDLVITSIKNHEGHVYLWFPVWSPDGTKIAYVHGTEFWKSNNLFVLDTETNESTQVSAFQDPTGGVMFRPEWSPDGTRIAVGVYREFERENAQIWIYEEGLNPQMFESDQLSDYQPFNVSWSNNETLLLTVGNLPAYYINFMDSNCTQTVNP